VAVAGDAIVAFPSMEPFATYTRAFDHVGALGAGVELSRRRMGIGSAPFEATFEEARPEAVPDAVYLPSRAQRCRVGRLHQTWRFDRRDGKAARQNQE
jgi:hypothetical protein